MQTDDTIDRIAKAIYETLYCDEWGEIGPYDKSLWRACAIAARDAHLAAIAAAGMAVVPRERTVTDG